MSEGIKRAFSLVNIRVVFIPDSTLLQQLVNVKDQIPPEKRANIVYSIPCKKCPAVCIGQTGRLLETRIREHKAAVKYAKCDVSAVADHIWNKQHQMDFHQVSI